MYSQPESWPSLVDMVDLQYKKNGGHSIMLLLTPEFHVVVWVRPRDPWTGWRRPNNGSTWWTWGRRVNDVNGKMRCPACSLSQPHEGTLFSCWSVVSLNAQWELACRGCKRVGVRVGQGWTIKDLDNWASDWRRNSWMDEEEDKTTKKLGVGRKKSMELKITGYGKIPSILTIVSIFCSQVVKLLTLFFWS